MTQWLTVLSSGSTSVVVTGVFVYLTKSWISERLKAAIQHEYEQKIEAYKAKIQHEYAQQIETHKEQLRSQTENEIVRLKAQLEIAAAERNVRFSKTFDHMAEVIAVTYGKLLAMKRAADDYTQDMDLVKEEREKLAEVYRAKSNEFLDYFPPKRIYLPKETGERIRKFNNTVHKAVLQYSMAVAASRGNQENTEAYEQRLERFFKSSDEVPKLLGLLEDDFQKLLGVGADNLANRSVS